VSRRKLSTPAWLALAAVVVAIVAVTSAFVVANYMRAPDITRERFEAARTLWAAKRPPGYDIEINVSGRQPAVYKVQVRNGVPAAASRNGYPLNRPHAMGTWAVDGMFDTMERDLENIELHAAGKATPTTPRVTIWGEFDPQLGYPASFTRVQWDTSYEVVWKVTRFAATTAAAPVKDNS